MFNSTQKDANSSTAKDGLLIWSFYPAPAPERRVLCWEQLCLLPLEKSAWKVQWAAGLYWGFRQYWRASGPKAKPWVHCCFPLPAAACLNWDTLEGNNTAGSWEQIHSKSSEEMERPCRILMDFTSVWWNQKLTAGFQAGTQTEGTDFPCHDKAGIGQASFQTSYTTKGDKDSSIKSLLNQNFKAKVNWMCALLGYHPPHCYLGSNSARRKPFLIQPKVQTMQRTEEIETILYSSSQRLKK